jgi:spore coat polysaccharide biosynthesis predicted glycosyltransferase SpsG
LLVFFGGGASALEYLRVLPVILPLPVRLDIVISSATPERATLERMLEGQLHASLHVDTEQMAKLLHAADLYVGAGGTVTWERACLGLPGVVAALSFNQQAISSACAEWGMQDYLGLSSTVQPIDWQLKVSQLLAQPERLERMRQRALALVDGRGVGRVVEAMECQV